MGLPLVSSDIPGCREIVRHGENGFLVAPGDVEELAGVLARLASDRQLRQRMGARGRQLVERYFSDEVVIEQTIAAYRRLGLNVADTTQQLNQAS